MSRYIFTRIGSGFATLLCVAMIVFVLVRVLPGDASVILTGAGSGSVSDVELAAVRHQLGIDQPIVVQFFVWVRGIASLDFGTSLRTGDQVMGEIIERFPYTLQIAVMAMSIAVLLGVPAGVLGARFAGSWPDRLLQTASVVGLATPSFWVSLVIILSLVTLFHWSAPLFWEPFWVSPVASSVQLIWPALAAGLRQISLIFRVSRSVMLDVLGEDYIRTARAKGLPERTVVFRHGLGNCSIQIVTLIGFEFAALFGSLIVTETVFSVPGLGQYAITSILNRDYPAAQAVIILLACIVVIGSLVVDLLYGWLDPRMRLGQSPA